MAGLQKADSGYEEGPGDIVEKLKSLLDEHFLKLEGKFSSQLQTTNEKLDVLTKRVSNIELKLFDEEQKKLNRDKVKQTGKTLTYGLSKPRLRRFAAVCCSEDSLHSSSSSDGSFNIRLEDLPSTCANVYKDVLVQEHEHILKDVDLNSTDVLDKLIADDAITTSDAEEIKRRGGRKDQARSLLLVLEQRGHGPFLSFVDSLEEDYNHLHQSLKRSLSIMYKEKKNGRLTCTVCKIIENVHPRDIIDKFYSQKLIQPKTMRDINQCGDPRRGWEQLRPFIKNEDAIKILADSLLPKYKSLSEELIKIKDMTRLVCFCKRLSAKRKREESTKVDILPQSPVEHSDSSFSIELQANKDPSDVDATELEKRPTASREFVSRFNESGFREKFNRQAIKKREPKGKCEEKETLKIPK
ncbi:uncharacterized protein LOC133189589 [Saccostrea echinata]|uniref:uncharacterized protein LOC133189589 n=1 Tax=Saccostrea echinata TaxID=191078 RepID=UPI002A830030|nr:uncharacterized protein LOC133189589 [Saccostrea echinata]